MNRQEIWADFWAKAQAHAWVAMIVKATRQKELYQQRNSPATFYHYERYGHRNR